MIDEREIEALRRRLERIRIRTDSAWLAEEARPLLASIDELLQHSVALTFPLPASDVLALHRFMTTAVDRLEEWLPDARRNELAGKFFAGFALRLYLLATMTRIVLPPGFWRLLTQFGHAHADTGPVRGELAWLFALAAADPRFMDGKELLWALRWIQSAAPVIALHGSCQDQEDGFVMSLSLDEPPEPRAWFLGRENGSRATLSFSLEDLAKRAEEAIRLLEGGDWAARRNQEGGLSADGRAALLRELLDRWRYGWQRRLPRKPFDAMAELLVGWEAVLSHRLGLPATIHPVRVTDVSISGYELRWTDNEAPIFFPGQIVAIRVGGDIRWVLALVRWLRQHPNGLQMGIQALGFDPEPVALGHEKSLPAGAAAQMALSVRKAPPLRLQSALVCTKGTVCGPKLVEASEPAVGKWLLRQVHFIRFEAQTRDVEVFQFEVDPFMED
jgi:hypothetical protein